MNLIVAKRNEVKFYSMKAGNEIKRNFTTEKTVGNDMKFRFKMFRNFFIVAHLSRGPPLKIHVTMVSCRSLCAMRLACKACSSHGMSPTFHGLVSSA